MSDRPQLQRDILPIPDRPHEGELPLDAKDPAAMFPPIEPLRATPVSDDYGPKDSEFTGNVLWVQLDIDETAEDVDHLISPEERLRVAMARQ